MKRMLWAVCGPLFFSCALASVSAIAQVNPNLYTGLEWRSVGPFHGGRISSVSGVAGDPGTFYMGTPLGGIWKTTSAGVTWFPIFDQQTSVDSIGAIQVAPSAPSIVYAGAGDPIGGSLGDGMWKSTDSGATWQHIGLEDTVKIDSILVDPADPNLVIVSALGDDHHKGGGVWRSTDGGQNWTSVLKPADYDGTRDLQFAYDDPDVMLAATQGTGGGFGPAGPTKRKPATVYKSTDEGKTWTQIKIPPFPGRVALAVAMHTEGKRIYIVGNNIESGSGLYRSDDGGETWQHMAGKDIRISNGQGSYSSGVYVDSQNPDIVYTMSTAMYRSTDGGIKFEPFKGAPGGEDYHKLWIDPTNGKHMLVGSDQGASVTLDDGKTWSLWYTQAISQVYHIATDSQYPYHIMAAQQDTGAVMISSRGNFGQINFNDWSPVPSSEFGVITPDPRNPNIIYGVGYGPGGGGSGLVKINLATSQWQNLAPNFGSESTKFTAFRDFQKKFDYAFEPGALYVAYQCLMVTRDGAHSFTAVSPDLTTAKGAPQADCSKPRPQPPPTPPGQIPPPPPASIADFSISRVKPGIIWSVSTNDQINITTDHGKVWNNVSNIADLPTHTNLYAIEAGDDAGTAYVAGRIGGARGQVVPPDEDTNVPLVWRTTDGGKTWASIVSGLPKDERTGSWVNSLRVDPQQAGLLFAGTETTVYVSFDNGDHWQSLRQNLPSTSIRDLEVHTDHHQNDLVIGTYGRGFWVLDDITPLREIAAKSQAVASSSVYFFPPEDAIRARMNANWDQPFSIEVPHAHNAQYGAILDYYLAHAPSAPIQLQVFDADGKLVRTMSSTLPPPIEGALFPHYWLATPESRALGAHVGLNRVNWNLYYDDPPSLRHDLEDEMNMVPGSTTPGPHGPQVIPGTYTLKLTVDGQVYTRTLTVDNDPRAGQTPELMAALRTQNKLNMLSIQGMEQSYAGYQEVKAIKDQLAAMLHDNLPADVSAQAKTLDASLTKIGGIIPGGFGGGGGGGRPPTPDPKAPKTFAELNNSYNVMVSMMQVGMDMAPTPTQVVTWETDCNDLNHTLDAWKNMQQEITGLNALLTKNQLHELTVAPTTLTNASCTFASETGRKAGKQKSSR